MLITSWTDPRLAIKTAPAMTLYGTDVFDKGLIWGPRLTFANRRDLTNPIDGVVRTYNTGRVEVVQRYLATYAMNLNMRDFPFDTQKFVWNIRSTTHNKSVLMFRPVRDVQILKNTSLQLQVLLDPTFSYSNYNQSTYTITEGIFKDFHLLSVSMDAQRLATMSSIFLIFPICLLCSALCLVFSQEPSNNARLSVPLGCITSCLAFSYVVSNQCPPVSYTTRLHLMIFFTYTVSITSLILNYYLWSIEFAKKELGRLNGDKKNLLMDAHWMPRKIGNAPTKVIILPGGIHKPPEKCPKLSDEGKKISDIGLAQDQKSNHENNALQSIAPAENMSTPDLTPRRSAWENNLCGAGKTEVVASLMHDMLPSLPGVVDKSDEMQVHGEPSFQTNAARLKSPCAFKSPIQEVFPEIFMLNRALIYFFFLVCVCVYV